MKTERGLRVLKDRSVPLTPRQRAAFILVDGKRSMVEVLEATVGMGLSMADLQHLVAAGLIGEVPAAEPATPAPAEPQLISARTPQERYHDAYPVAAQLTAGLGLRGFRLNLAVEAAASFAQLSALAPKIEQAVGPEKFAPLDEALHG